MQPLLLLRLKEEVGLPQLFFFWLLHSHLDIDYFFDRGPEVSHSLVGWLQLELLDDTPVHVRLPLGCGLDSGERPFVVPEILDALHRLRLVSLLHCLEQGVLLSFDEEAPGLDPLKRVPPPWALDSEHLRGVLVVFKLERGERRNVVPHPLQGDL